MKDLIGWLLWLLLVVLTFASLLALSLFLNCLPATVLGHILKG